MADADAPDGEAARRARAERAMKQYLAQQDAEAATAPKTVTRPAAPAGWYAHPSMADTQRYWDGSNWTDHVAPGLPQRQQQAESRVADEKSNSVLIGVGIIMMFIFPIGGFIAGCVLLAKKVAVGGAVIMLLSVVSGYVWYDFYTEHQRTECVLDNADRVMDGLPSRDCG